MIEVEHIVQMSIDDWKQYENDEDVSIALAKVEFLSDAPNSHRHIYTLDVIKKYADTYLGKFVVSKWDKITQDAGTHEYDQTIVGYIPSNQKVQYEQKADGYWYASVDVVISKIYAPEIYNVLKSDDRSVSVEQLVGFTKETEEYIDGEKDKIVEGFEGIGITILGKRFNPSVPNANIKITRMSEDNIKDIEKEYTQYSKKNSDDISEKILAKLENIESKLNIDKEETMADIKKEEVALEELQEENMAEEKEVVENADTEVEEVTNAETEEKEVVENACDDSEKMEALKEELSKAETKMSEMENELNELREFKNKAEMAQKQSIIEDTLAQVKDFADEETYNSFVDSAKECSYADIGSWKNEVLANVASKAIAKMSEQNNEDGVLDLGMPKDIETKTSIYD